MDYLNLQHTIRPNMVRRRDSDNGLKLKGRYDVDHIRNGVLIGKYPILNDITNLGKNTIFDVMFSDGTQIPASGWFMGLINLTGYSALAATDIMTSHAGWTEFTAYAEANRLAWGPGEPSAQSITNASPVTFTITGSGTVKGLFMCSNNTKSGTSGVLWSTGLFPADVPVVNGDELKSTYTVNA